MTNYHITTNYTYNSREITFDGIPAKEVREALKSLKMRWNPKKSCWYGFAQEHEIISAILDNSESETANDDETDGATVYTDGYMGGGAVYGSKSNQPLYGADLSKAIREDIKKAGIKGVSVRCKSYSGGQSITATVSLPESAFVPEADFIANYEINYHQSWIYYADSCGKVQSVHIEKYFDSDDETRKSIKNSAAMYEYDRETRHECQINHIDSYKSFTEKTRQLLKKIEAIITAYRYDESNAMVDYFNTNFYFDIVTKPAK